MAGGARDAREALRIIIDTSPKHQVIAGLALSTGKVPRSEVLSVLGTLMACNKHDMVANLHKLYHFEPEELVPILMNADLTHVSSEKQHLMVRISCKSIHDYIRVLTSNTAPMPVSMIEAQCELDRLATHELRFLISWLAHLDVQLNHAALKWFILNVINQKGLYTKLAIFNTLLYSRHSAHARYVDVPVPAPAHAPGNRAPYAVSAAPPVAPSAAASAAPSASASAASTESSVASVPVAVSRKRKN
jgi:hypothetical protein